MHVHIFEKPVIIDLKVFKMQRYSSITLQRGQRKWPPQKSKLLLKKFSWLIWSGPKTTEPIRFQKSCMKNQLKLVIPKKCGFWSRKGSKIWTLFYILVPLTQNLIGFKWPVTVKPVSSVKSNIYQTSLVMSESLQLDLADIW